MRAILIGATLATLLAGAAMAADDSILATRFGNTTLATDAAGTQTRLYYNADHTFTAKQGVFAVSGTWKIDGDNVCLIYGNSASSAPTCLPVVAHNVGDTWTTGDGAAKRLVTLLKGIQ